tara:strand:+ start:338 stop:649 length:312 start_codon:yes stop_codon:yes gene_type:complete
MASEIATDIVNKIFADDKSGAIDAVADGLNTQTYELVQQKKIEFAKQWGFNPDDTAQAVADELTDELPDNTDVPETPEVEASSEDPEPETEVTTEEEPENETD